MYTVPFDVEVLRQIVTGELNDFIIDYSKSTIKGKNFITYMSNLNVKKPTISFSDVDVEELKALVVEYVRHPSMCHVPQLEATLLKCLFAVKGFSMERVDLSVDDASHLSQSILTNEQIIDVVETNKDLFVSVARILDGMVLYAVANLTSFKEAYEGQPVAVKHVTEALPVGKTFVNLLSNETFNCHYYGALPPFETLEYFDHYYDRPIYSGKTLISYLSSDQCFVFPLLKLIIEQRFTTDDLEKMYEETNAALI